MTDQTNTEAGAVAELALAGLTVDTNTDAVLVPMGYQVKDLRDFHSTPARASGTVELDELDGFVAYVQRFRTEDSVVVLTPENSRKVPEALAVFDFGGPEAPGWQQHGARLRFQVPAATQRWLDMQGKMHAQRKLAEFLEDNLDAILDPKPAKMLEAVLAFKTSQRATFESKVKLDNGDLSLAYKTDTQQQGTVHFPAEFTLKLQPYVGGPFYEVLARTRYDVADGDLSLRFDLPTWERVLELAVTDVLVRLRAEFDAGDQVRVFVGIPSTFLSR